MAARMTRAQFIADHLLVCEAGRARKYDARKPSAALHSLDYSRRKCAAALWRRRCGRHGLKRLTEKTGAVLDVRGKSSK